MDIIGGLICTTLSGMICGYWIGYHSKSKQLKGCERL